MVVYTYRNEHTDEKQWPFDQQFHLLLNLAVTSDWETNVDPESFRKQFEIDYMRS